MDVLKSPEKFEDDSAVADRPKPRTWSVLGLLVTAAGTFSYLGAFAATDALAKVDVIRPIPRDHDPRPLWAAIGFVTIMSLFLVIAVLMRHLSSRQFRCIDRMSEEGG
jgi:hypothetical protein